MDPLDKQYSTGTVNLTFNMLKKRLGGLTIENVGVEDMPDNRTYTRASQVVVTDWNGNTKVLKDRLNPEKVGKVIYAFGRK